MKKAIGWTTVIIIFLAVLGYTLFSHANRCSDIAKDVSRALERYGACEEDSDCTVVTLTCPFSCNTPLNRASIQSAFAEVALYQKNCMMVCPDCPPASPGSVFCRNAQCVNSQ